MNETILDQNICNALEASAYPVEAIECYWAMRNAHEPLVAERKAWLFG